MTISQYTRGIGIDISNVALYLESTNCKQEQRDQIQAALQSRLALLGSSVSPGTYVDYKGDYAYRDTNGTNINTAVLFRWIRTASTAQISQLQQLEDTIEVFNGAAPTVTTGIETKDVVKATNSDWDPASTGTYPVGETLANRAYRAVSQVSPAVAPLASAIAQGDVVVSLVDNPDPSDPNDWVRFPLGSLGVFSSVFS